MIKVAITGNIGSGKSTVCKIFESLGISIYSADREAKKFYRNEDVIDAVKDLFGADVFDAQNQLKRSLLASRAFGDHKKLGQLNAIIHPLVLRDFMAWAGERSHEPYTLYESALLFESGFYKYFDSTILVTAPVELARDRVTKRDQITAREFDARLATQWKESKKTGLAGHVINNNGRQALIPQVIDLHNTFSS